LGHFAFGGDIVVTPGASRPPANGRGQNPAPGRKEVAMAWIAALGLMIGAMVTLSSIGAEVNFRRTLDPSER
jgi:hypothetical protein